MANTDHVTTAPAIPSSLDLGNDPALTGAAFTRLDDAGFARAVGRVGVFMLTGPGHGLCIVHALQKSGTIMAKTGDGINDAPSPKLAALRIVMGWPEHAAGRPRRFRLDRSGSAVAAGLRHGSARPQQNSTCRTMRGPSQTY